MSVEGAHGRLLPLPIKYIKYATVYRFTIPVCLTFTTSSVKVLAFVQDASDIQAVTA